MLVWDWAWDNGYKLSNLAYITSTVFDQKSSKVFDELNLSLKIHITKTRRLFLKAQTRGYSSNLKFFLNWSFNWTAKWALVRIRKLKKRKLY